MELGFIFAARNISNSSIATQLEDYYAQRLIIIVFSTHERVIFSRDACEHY